MKMMSLKILTRDKDMKQMEFTLSGKIQNPDIDAEKLALLIEHTLNGYAHPIRAHISVEEVP